MLGTALGPWCHPELTFAPTWQVGSNIVKHRFQRGETRWLGEQFGKLWLHDELDVITSIHEWLDGVFGGMDWPRSGQS